jgi:hypothetical protein
MTDQRLVSASYEELHHSSTTIVPAMLRNRLTKFFVAIGDEIPSVFMSDEDDDEFRGTAT